MNLKKEPLFQKRHFENYIIEKRTEIVNFHLQNTPF
jgi:hypothetical protein